MKALSRISLLLPLLLVGCAAPTSDEAAIDGPIAEAPSALGVPRIVSGGSSFACALMPDTTVRCWGLNAHLELGPGGVADSGTPITITGLSGVVQLTTGDAHACALLTNGTVRCWGAGSWGRLGDGGASDRATPAPVVNLSGVVSVSAGAQYTCAVLYNHTARCWGYNGVGQLGNGTTTNKVYPSPVVGLNNIASLEAGADFTCALLLDHRIRCWGANWAGQLATGVFDGGSLTPSPTFAYGISDAVAVSVGATHACAILADASAKCWGDNATGAIGDGTTVNRAFPTSVSLSVSQIEPGEAHTCALTTGGAMYCWGRGAFGELGQGDLLDRPSPTLIMLGGSLAGIATGRVASFAVLSDGTGRSWGQNDVGLLGLGYISPATPAGLVTSPQVMVGLP